MSINLVERAISYAKTTHTESGDDVEVEHWPKRSSPLETLPEMLGQDSSSIVDAFIAFLMGMDDDSKPGIDQLLDGLIELKFAEKPYFMLAMDEKTAIDIIMRGE